MESNVINNAVAVGEVVKTKNNDGTEFNVRIVNIFRDIDDGKMYCTIEPVDFKGFEREVPLSKIYR